MTEDVLEQPPGWKWQRVPNEPDKMAFFVYISEDDKIRVPTWKEPLRPYWHELLPREFVPLDGVSVSEPSFEIRTYRLEKIIGPKYLTDAGVRWLWERLARGLPHEIIQFEGLLKDHNATNALDDRLQDYIWSWEFTDYDWVKTRVRGMGFEILITQRLPERGHNWRRSILGMASQ